MPHVRVLDDGGIDARAQCAARAERYDREAVVRGEDQPGAAPRVSQGAQGDQPGADLQPDPDRLLERELANASAARLRPRDRHPLAAAHRVPQARVP